MTKNIDGSIKLTGADAKEYTDKVFDSTVAEYQVTKPKNGMKIERQIIRAYSGRSGCACGCLGRYYDDTKNIKRIVKLIEESDPQHITVWDFAINYDDGKKSYTAYYPEHMGLKQDKGVFAHGVLDPKGME